MEIHVYLINPGVYRILIYGPKYIQLFRGNVPAADVREALMKALDQIPEDMK